MKGSFGEGKTDAGSPENMNIKLELKKIEERKFPHF